MNYELTHAPHSSIIIIEDRIRERSHVQEEEEEKKQNEEIERVNKSDCISISYAFRNDFSNCFSFGFVR